ncbi:type II toxin-antitoxin system VapC family toxin [uncultured Amnibacterium sp.]|uniref:type II toxin-antitoxin system VapC family toxin n=1 Tax=uncultured Amnibacterium sp. TaxID=1631851 RepID=UPI0035CB2114
MIVVDASTALSGLLAAGPARQWLASEQLHAPHLIDSEVASGLRRRVRARLLTAEQGWATLDTWRRIGITRYPVPGLVERIWQLRDNLSSYDAGYVALAEALECPLVTADARISGAPGLRCSVTVVPR